LVPPHLDCICNYAFDACRIRCVGDCLQCHTVQDLVRSICTSSSSVQVVLTFDSNDSRSGGTLFVFIKLKSQ
jgi:hypothetical protein